MTRITEGALTFEFPVAWKASKFDDWSFYRNNFDKVGNAQLVCKASCGGVVRCDTCGSGKSAGTKGIDILAIDPHHCCWLIEIKDYSQHVRTKAINVADEVALKARDTLAALAAARINANDAAEKSMASDAMKCSKLRIVLHLEQADVHSKLHPRPIDPALITQRLKQLVKAVDPHPKVLDRVDGKTIGWTVSGAASTP